MAGKNGCERITFAQIYPERWGTYITSEIAADFPSPLFHALGRIKHSSFYHNQPATDWLSPSFSECAYSTILLPREFVREQTNLLEDAVTSWGSVDRRRANFDLEFFQGPAVVLYSGNSNREPYFWDEMGFVSTAYDNRIFIPEQYNGLSVRGRAIIILGAVNEASAQLVLRCPRLALDLLGKETYSHYVGQFRDRCNEKLAGLYQVMGEQPVDLAVPVPNYHAN